MQIVQGTVVFIAECACDSFFFSITVHLCGQLELLKMKFTEIDKNSDNKHRNGNILGPLVERHCHLIVLARNIEDAFNIYILLRLLIINIVIATGGNIRIRIFANSVVIDFLIKISQYHNQNYSKIDYLLNVQQKSHKSDNEMIREICLKYSHQKSIKKKKDQHIFVIQAIAIFRNKCHPVV